MMAVPKVELVAHRHGNDPALAAVGATTADLIEIDVHLWRGRLEVRHAKRIWIFQRQWEQWDLLPTDAPVWDFEAILSAIPSDAPLLVDLKGWRPGMAKMIRTAIGEDRPVIVSARSWWLLKEFGSRPHTRLLRSVGTRWQLWLVQRLRRRPSVHVGVVVHQRLLESEVVKRLLEITPLIFTWNVDTVERAEALVDMGVSGLIIDGLDLIRVLRTRLGA